MKISLAPPCALSAQLCAKLAPLGLKLTPQVGLERNLMFEAPVSFAADSYLMRLKCGAYSCAAEHCALQLATIGRYCTIGPHVQMGVGVHNVHAASTSHSLRHNPCFMSISGPIALSPDQITADGEDFNALTVGPDVWIGAHCIFPRNVTIGTGAVIGAGSIITHDVPPYAIVAGKGGGEQSRGIIKGYRFPDEVISDLLELKWWHYDLPQMRASGIKIALEPISDFIAFWRNEEREHLIPLPARWRYLQVEHSNQVKLYSVDPTRSHMGTLLTPPELVLAPA